MMRDWKMLGSLVVLAGTLTVSPAAEPNKEDAIVRGLGDLKTSMDMLTELVRKLQAATLNTDLAITKHQNDIADIRRDIAQLRQDLDAMNRRVAPPRVSSYPPNPTPAPTGRIRLVNTYVQPVTIIVNRTPYTLQPNQTETISSAPAGPFSYEVLGIQQAVERTLAPNETFTITVHPG
jgi:hypothetical protein